jgi:ribosomal protein S18 acetylase RimI-like enzyme
VEQRSPSRLTQRASSWLAEHAPQRSPTAASRLPFGQRPASDSTLGQFLIDESIAAPVGVLDPERPATDPTVRLRPATRYDQDLLRAIYTASRATDFAALPAALAAALLDFQFLAHRLDRARRWSRAIDQIIEVRGVPAGRLTVSITSIEMRIVDLALLPGFQAQGVDATVLTQLLDESAARNLPLRLIADNNPRGSDLFRRVGLRVVAESPTDVELES